jgi:hypothetical protein
VPTTHAKGSGALVLAFGLIAAACGGGGDSGPGPNGAAGSTSSTVSSGSGGATELAAPTLEADPGQAWVEVDGDRFDYEAAGSLYYECSIDDKQIIVNFQTSDGHDLSVTGSRISGTLNVTTTFTDGGGAGISYGGILTGSDRGRIGIGDSQLSYEGPVNRTPRSDPTNTKAVDAKIAVNCAASGDDPTATVDGQTFSVPLAGAQSVNCDVAPGTIDIIINRLSRDGLQMQVSVRTESSGLVGAVTLTTPDGSYSGTIPLDGEGLTVDGNTVTFEGTFTSPGGDEVHGTAEVTCP